MELEYLFSGYYGLSFPLTLQSAFKLGIVVLIVFKIIEVMNE